MPKGDVETYHEDGQWKNKIEGNDLASNVHEIKAAAVGAGSRWRCSERSSTSPQHGRHDRRTEQLRRRPSGHPRLSLERPGNVMPEACRRDSVRDFLVRWPKFTHPSEPGLLAFRVQAHAELPSPFARDDPLAKGHLPDLRLAGARLVSVGQAVDAPSLHRTAHDLDAFRTGTTLNMWVNEGIGSPAFQARSWKA